MRVSEQTFQKIVFNALMEYRKTTQEERNRDHILSTRRYDNPTGRRQESYVLEVCAKDVDVESRREGIGKGAVVRSVFGD